MLNFNVHYSSSSGNLYRLSGSLGSLLIDPGIRFPLLQKALDFRLSGVGGCLVSHEHQDHAKSAAKIMTRGVDLYTSQGTADALGLSGHRLHTIEAGEQFSVAGFDVMPFETVHDCSEPLGFLIKSGPNKLLFAVDTMYVPHTFSGLTHIAVECNHCEDLLDANINAGLFPAMIRPRVRNNHISLQTFKKMLLANDLSTVREIHMIHMSSVNSDKPRFRAEIQAMVGGKVYVH